MASRKNIKPKARKESNRKPKASGPQPSDANRSQFVLADFSKRSLTPKQKRMWELEKFLLKVIVLVVPVYLILTFGVDLWPAQAEVARESAWAMQAAGINATLVGTGIIAEFPGTPPFFFTMSPDCTGWKAMLFFAALLLAVPGREWERRLAGLASGLAALWLVNLLRVFAVVSAYSSRGMGTAMLVHDWLWQTGMGLAALLLWAAWLKLTGRRR